MCTVIEEQKRNKNLYNDKKNSNRYGNSTVIKIIEKNIFSFLKKTNSMKKYFTWEQYQML